MRRASSDLMCNNQLRFKVIKSQTLAKHIFWRNKSNPSLIFVKNTTKLNIGAHLESFEVGVEQGNVYEHREHFC